MKSLILRLVSVAAMTAAFGSAFAQSSGGTTVQPCWSANEATQWGIPTDTPLPAGMGGVDSLQGFDLNRIRFFAGKRLDCKNMLGGLLKCCKKTVPDPQKDWWDQYRKTQKQSTAFDASKLIDHVQGAWNQMQGGADHWDLNSSFTSSFENLTGGGANPTDSGFGSIGQANDTFMDGQNKNVKPKLGWYCDDSDFEVAVQKQVGTCHYLGSKCQSKVLGVCLVKKELYCCFNSPITRIMREDMMSRGIGDMGDAKHPNCAGLSVAQVSGGALDEIDTNEMIGRMQMGGFLPDDVMDPNAAESLYTGAGSTYGDPSRIPVSQRTDQHLESMDYQGATSSINDDLSKTLPTQSTDAPTGPGQITFTTGYYSFDSGKPAVISMSRNGGTGMVSVVFNTQSGSAADGRDYSGVSQTIYWSQGDVGEKTVSVPTSAFGGSDKRTFKIVLSQPTGGATVTPYTNVDVDLRPSEN